MCLALLTLMSCLFLCLVVLIYKDVRRTDLPSGVCGPAKLFFVSINVHAVFRVALLLEKLGICHKSKIFRVAFNGIPPMKDSRLIIKDLVFDEVPVRLYCPKTSTPENRRGMIYLHGGVAIFGSIRGYERVCRYIARESNSVVVSVGFRLAPEHLYPVPVLDCCTAAIHFLKNAKDYGVDPNHIAIGGDSSGGTFAAVVCQELVTRVDLPRMQAQIMVYPFLQAVDFSLPSHQQNHSVPMLFKKWAIRLGFEYVTGKISNIDEFMRNAHVPEDMRMKYRKWISADNIPEEFKVRGYVPEVPAPFSEHLYETCQPVFEPRFSPLLAEYTVIEQLPETFILTCEYDVMRDDGLLYKKRLEDNGVPVTWHHVQDGFHGMISFIDYGPLEFQNSRTSLQHLTHFLESL
ncbi:arylacetamide deacetylase-like 4 [Rhineura floridana]|uniref:arylacetamide deacetylase-like 4 n=1 Tax=Rhineura floridana TaxID=261503 RepID=UPI002AC87944|nr:arylacetamide deacetylase-like 4 [Rhineura floridana]